MKSSTEKIQFLVFSLCLIFSTLTFTKTEDIKTVEAATNAIDETNEALEKSSGIEEKANTSKTFESLSNALGILGPIMMTIQSEMANAAIVEPLEESAELKAINAGFEKVNRKIDLITSDVRDLKVIIELSNAKSSYTKLITAIDSTYEALEEAKVEKEQKSYDFFAKLYESSYNLAADNIFDAMTGTQGPFGFNLVSLYKDHVKCNPVLISKFCTMGIKLINKGLVVEGAYLGTLNLVNKAQGKQEIWEKKLKTLGDSCTAIIRRCEHDWKIISAQQFRDSYNRDLSKDNQDFANKIVKSLNEVVPQKSWFAVAYDDASGNGEHTYSSFYESDQLWNKNKHDVTLFSAPVEETLTGEKYDEFKKLIDEQKAVIAAVDDCKMVDKWSREVNRYEGNDSNTIVKLIREVLKKGVIYSVRLDKNPGFAVSGNTLYESEQEWKCTSQNYRLLIFV